MEEEDEMYETSEIKNTRLQSSYKDVIYKDTRIKDELFLGINNNILDEVD